ncbi:hypothetical protein BGX21_004337 [Mortierella sp. AD011]|nr:hypothetical protein BGX20_010061 [Mortierella sp. AD010]KAF9400428.1 hypothetical protein BGX21_004337 [Mortierella sp. AD011]
MQSEVPHRHSFMGSSSSEDQHAIKGILKKPMNSGQQPEENTQRLKWDEENLMITEAQKDSTMKIDEPKTPFVHYNFELDKVMDPGESFSLDGPRKKIAALAHTPPVRSYFPNLDDEEGDNDDDDDNDEDDDDRDRDPEEWQDSDEEEDHEKSDSKEVDTVDHEKFARLRAEHYKMKEAIKLGHRLVEEGEEDEDEDEDEDDNDREEENKVKEHTELGSKDSAALGSNAKSNTIFKREGDADSLDMDL